MRAGVPSVAVSVLFAGLLVGAIVQAATAPLSDATLTPTETVAAGLPETDRACGPGQTIDRGPVEQLTPRLPNTSWPDVVVDLAGTATTTFAARSRSSTQGILSVDVAGATVGTSQVVSGEDAWASVGNQDLTDTLGIDDAGNQTLLFTATELSDENEPTDATRIMVTNRPAGGAWQPAVAVTDQPHFIDHAQLAVNATGAAVVAWNRDVRRTYAAYRPAVDAPWTRPHLISRRNWFVEVGIDDAGNALVATFPDGIDVTRRLVDGGWTDPVTIARHSQSSPSVAASGDGTAYVSWAKRAADSQVTHVVSRMTPDGVWQPARVIGVGVRRPSADLAVDDHGRATFAWWDVPGFDNGISRGDVHVSRSRPDGSWPRSPSTLATDERSAAWPQIQVQSNGRGDAVVVWNTRAHGALFLEASYRPTGGAWTRRERLTTRTARPDLYATAVGEGGHAAASWMRRGRVWARVLAPCSG